MAEPAMKRVEQNGVQKEPPARITTHEDIAVLAYQLWQDRGCPDGSPEVDWLEAEEQLKDLAAHNDVFS